MDNLGLCIGPANAFMLGMQRLNVKRNISIKHFFSFSFLLNITFCPYNKYYNSDNKYNLGVIYMLEAQDKQKIQIKQQYSGYDFIYSVDLYIRTYIKKNSNSCQKCQKWYGKAGKRERKTNCCTKATSFENVLIAIHTFSEVFSAVPENDTQHERQVRCLSDVSSLKWEVETLSQRLEWCTDCHSI